MGAVADQVNEQVQAEREAREARGLLAVLSVSGSTVVGTRDHTFALALAGDGALALARGMKGTALTDDDFVPVPYPYPSSWVVERARDRIDMLIGNGRDNDASLMGRNSLLDAEAGQE